MDKSLTDGDVRRLTDNEIPVMTYSELIDNGVLDVLLSTPSMACICLIRTALDYGHWVLIWLKTKGKEKGFYFYDSYGNEVDSNVYKKFVSTELLKQIHQDEPYLLKELYDSGFKIYFNEYPHQSSNKNVSTCGRHSVVRSSFLDMDTDEYDKMITAGSLTPDEKVLLLTEI